MLGSIGVVYGDIGTSPLYALREAVVAASGPDGGTATAQAVLGVLSLILWALIVVVTLKYVVILLRADNNGEGGTLALMALAQRAASKGAGLIVLLGIISGALFYGDAVITPALSVLSAIEGIKLVTVTLRALCRAADRADPGGAVCGPVAGHRACRRVLRAHHVRLVRRARDCGGAADRAASRGAAGAQSALCRLIHDPSRRDRLRHAGRGVSRRDRGRGALCRPRAFRQTADPDRVAVHRAAVAGAELYGAGRARHCRSQGDREPVLPDVSRTGR